MARQRFYQNGVWVSFSRITDFSSLVIGKSYYVSDGFWSGIMVYCGHVHDKRKYTFTFGDTVDSWRNNICLCACKSNLKVYSL